MVITRNGEPAAVLISPAELESIDATLEILSDPTFDLAGFLAEQSADRAEPGNRISDTEMTAAWEHRRATGRWPAG